jgi:hypothetical protein
VREEIDREQFKRAEREDRHGVVMVGIAQEKRTDGRVARRCAGLASALRLPPPVDLPNN